MDFEDFPSGILSDSDLSKSINNTYSGSKGNGGKKGLLPQFSNQSISSIISASPSSEKYLESIEKIPKISANPSQDLNGILFTEGIIKTPQPISILNRKQPMPLNENLSDYSAEESNGLSRNSDSNTNIISGSFFEEESIGDDYASRIHLASEITTSGSEDLDKDMELIKNIGDNQKNESTSSNLGNEEDVLALFNTTEITKNALKTDKKDNREFLRNSDIEKEFNAGIIENSCYDSKSNNNNPLNVMISKKSKNDGTSNNNLNNEKSSSKIPMDSLLTQSRLTNDFIDDDSQIVSIRDEKTDINSKSKQSKLTNDFIDDDSQIMSIRDEKTDINSKSKQSKLTNDFIDDDSQIMSIRDEKTDINSKSKQSKLTNDFIDDDSQIMSIIDGKTDINSKSKQSKLTNDFIDDDSQIMSIRDEKTDINSKSIQSKLTNDFIDDDSQIMSIRDEKTDINSKSKQSKLTNDFIDDDSQIMSIRDEKTDINSKSIQSKLTNDFIDDDNKIEIISDFSDNSSFSHSKDTFNGRNSNQNHSFKDSFASSNIIDQDESIIEIEEEIETMNDNIQKENLLDPSSTFESSEHITSVKAPKLTYTNQITESIPPKQLKQYEYQTKANFSMKPTSDFVIKDSRPAAIYDSLVLRSSSTKEINNAYYQTIESSKNKMKLLKQSINSLIITRKMRDEKERIHKGTCYNDVQLEIESRIKKQKELNTNIIYRFLVLLAI